MRYSLSTPLVASALAGTVSAFVVPPADLGQAPLVSDGRPNNDAPSSSHSWWDSLRDLASESSINPHLPSTDDISSFIDDSVHHVASGLDEAAKSWNEVKSKLVSFLQDAVDAEDTDRPGRHGPHGRHGHHEFPDHTIYQLIQASNYTKKFAKLIDEHPKVVKILNSTDAANHTLFVPVDEAFEHIPDDHEKPSKEFIENALLYHIGLGNLPAVKLLKSNTVPTAYDEKFIGDEPQRLRTSLGLGGIKINFYSRVIAADVKAKNGIIHAVRELIVPPFMVGRTLTLFPGEFSTLLLAYEKTDFVDYIHDVKMIGSTVFAPSNGAFQKLGPRANAFLFNSETGLKYLKAILKYHIVANATLYTDAFYDKTESKSEDVETTTAKREHFDLVTLLHDLHLSVDIAEWASLTFVKVNGFVNVQVRDGIAKNGVVHVIDRVLIPPHKHHDSAEDESWTGEIEVEDLKERLADYV